MPFKCRCQPNNYTEIISNLKGWCSPYIFDSGFEPYIATLFREIEGSINFNLKIEPRSIIQNHRLFSDLGCTICGADVICGRLDGLLHVSGLSDSGFTQQAKLLLASSPKLISSEPQSYGGNGENYGEPSNHALVVVLKEVVGPFENERNSRVESGAVFPIIMIGGLLTVLWLYQAQR